MKLVLNIEKKHLIFFSVFLVLVLGAFAIANSNLYTNGEPTNGVGHTDLFTENIYPFNYDNNPSVHIRSNHLYLDGFVDGNDRLGPQIKLYDGSGYATIKLTNSGDLQFCNTDNECHTLSQLALGAGISQRTIEFEFTYDDDGNEPFDCWTSDTRERTCILENSPYNTIEGNRNRCPDVILNEMIANNNVPGIDLLGFDVTNIEKISDEEVSDDNEYGNCVNNDVTASTRIVSYSLTLEEQ